jgi:chromosomal replication initiator protein
VAGPENHLAVAAVLGLLGSHGTRQPWRPDLFRPLMLYGPPGSGKSHLAQGLAEQWARLNPHDRVVAVEASEFAAELNDAIESHTVSTWRRRYRQANLLVVEQLDALARRGSAQSELLATIDELLAADAAIVITSRKSPAQLAGLLPALASRLTGGLTVPLAMPQSAARRALLQLCAARHQLQFDSATLELLTERLPAGVVPLHTALLALSSETRDSDGKVRFEDALRYINTASRGNALELQHVAARTAAHFGISLTDLKSPSRRRGVVMARDVAMLLCRRLTGKSLQQIGRYFGGRDHTTVLHGCRKTEALLADEPSLAENVRQLELTLLGKSTISKGRQNR